MNRIKHKHIFLRSMRSFAVNKSLIVLGIILLPVFVFAQSAGGIRGTVQDKEFDAPLAAAQVSIAETGEKVVASEEGSFVFGQVPPGTYTLVFSKDGYTRQVAADVVVAPGQMTDANASLSGEFTEMDEFVVQDVSLGGSTATELLSLKQNSSVIVDSIGSDVMKQAGASTAANALGLVTGASVQDGKYAVIRGLADRYVSTQLNSVRLPTADADKRAVQLDQFPSALIQSIQVSKSFTPDQQGDATGGGINIKTKAIPDESVLSVGFGLSYNTQTTGNDQFLRNNGGGVDFTGMDDGGRALPLEDVTQYANNAAARAAIDAESKKFQSSMGMYRKAPDPDYSMNATVGNSHEFSSGPRVGFLGSMYYRHKYSSVENGVKGKGDVSSPGSEITSETVEESSGKEEVLWGVLGVLGFEFAENQSVALTYSRSHAAEDSARILEDRDSPLQWDFDEISQYKERSLESVQLRGEHEIPLYNELSLPMELVTFMPPEFDWTLALSEASDYSPDKKLFSSSFLPEGQPNPANDNKWIYPNAQRIWQDIVETSKQASGNFTLPFTQWSDRNGELKLGQFIDSTDREFELDTFEYKRHYGDNFYYGDLDDTFSDVFLDPGRIGINPANTNRMLWYIQEVNGDVDYTGTQEIAAWYGMATLPLTSMLEISGGMRVEKTELATEIRSDRGDGKVMVIRKYPGLGYQPTLVSEDEAGTSIEQIDRLPSIGAKLELIKNLNIRATYSETIARPTFKEITPVITQEYLGSEYTAGNPDLTISSIKNYDLRLEYFPRPGDVIAVGWFFKKIKDPIEKLTFSTAYDTYFSTFNYPEGTVSGLEFEFRQKLDIVSQYLSDFTVGANATLIQSEVLFPEDERQTLEPWGAGDTRPMVDQPDVIYNFNLTYENKDTGTTIGLFYNLTGEKLISGQTDGAEGDYIPNIYQMPSDSLSLSLSQKIGGNWKITLAAKNLTDPIFEDVYRTNDGKEAPYKSYRKGIEYSISAGYEF